MEKLLGCVSLLRILTYAIMSLENGFSFGQYISSDYVNCQCVEHTTKGLGL
jgi:hypothetical protein